MLDDKLSTVFRTTKAHAATLKELGLITVSDLLHYYPRDYEDRSCFTTVSNIRTDETNVLRGRLFNLTSSYSKSRMLVIRALFKDDTGSIEVVWFNQPYILKVLRSGDEVILSGKAKFAFGKISLQSPDYERFSQEMLHTARIIPIYPESPPITSKWLREKINSLKPYFNEFYEYLPDDLLNRQQLIDHACAMREIHFPSSIDLIAKARHRLAFDELFMIQLLALQKRYQWIKSAEQKDFSIEIDYDLSKKFIAELPYELTQAQKIALDEIYADLQKKQPMLRLFQGDVGSGKTIVASVALLQVIRNGNQGAIMAPTEILARQHFATIKQLLNNFDFRCELLVGSLSQKDKLNIAQGLKEGSIDLVVGTHALIQEYVGFKKLGFAVIDEQHRFGVLQREQIKKYGNPNLLNMTATPIPRTLAMTIYGDQDLSVLDEMPPGRKKIITRIVPEQKRNVGYRWIEEQVKLGRQVFVICPLIDESDVLEVKSAIFEHDRLSKEIFPNLRVGLLHGQMKSDDKEEIMSNFKNMDLDILVSTSVIEVGIDIPNATIMMIEGAERFGLAQLHQFRGRVGRGEHQSYCFLFPTIYTAESQKRLKYMEQYHSGFQLSEIDLKIRGPGEIYGYRQSGIPDLKMASLNDYDLLKSARDEASTIVHTDPELLKFPLLREQVQAFKERHIMADSV